MVITKRKAILICSLYILFNLGCAPKVKESYDEKEGYTGSISISGAFALYPLVILWSEDFKKLNPKVRFNISAGGAGKGIADVLTNMVDIGLVSRDLHVQETERGAFPIVVAKDAVIATINSEHPNIQLIKDRGLKRQEFIDLFINQKYKNWNDLDSRFIKQPVEVFVRSDAAGAAETWAKYLGQSQEDLKGIGIFGDPGLAQSIKDNKLAIGFNNINYVYDIVNKKTSANITVVPLDINENGKIDAEENFYDHLDSLVNAVSKKVYPSPPSRDLLFVIQKDNSSPLVKAFIAFVLEKQQQAILLPNGYVPLNEEIKNKELEKLSK
ncbi:PstS family phosphate ABC transporter substrate-binding protein [Sphingobacterium hungaricum]